MTSAQPPPWAQRIRQRREALFPPVSRRQAALAAGVSVSTWIEIENAAKKVAPGVEVEVRGTPDKVARMAEFLEITPDELREDGRDDAARHLEALLGRAQTVLTERQKRMLGRKISQDDG